MRVASYHVRIIVGVKGPQYIQSNQPISGLDIQRVSLCR